MGEEMKLLIETFKGEVRRAASEALSGLRVEVEAKLKVYDEAIDRHTAQITQLREQQKAHQTYHNAIMVWWGVAIVAIQIVIGLITYFHPHVGG